MVKPGSAFAIDVVENSASMVSMSITNRRRETTCQPTVFLSFMVYLAIFNLLFLP
jgi:hypothetical protein